jgi:hypothetical protein
MTKQHEPIFRKCTAYQAINLLYSLSLVKGNCELSAPMVLELRWGTSSPKAVGCTSHWSFSWFTYCFSSDLCYSTFLIILFILFILQGIFLTTDFSTGKTGLHNVRLLLCGAPKAGVLQPAGLFDIPHVCSMFPLSPPGGSRSQRRWRS